MPRFPFAAPLLLALALAVHAQQPAPSSASPAPAPLTAPVIAPNENLVAEGIPTIPAALADEVRRYTEARSARFLDWHPTRHEMLVSTRFAETPQVHLVRTPLGARTQLTFFPERVGSALWQPTTGDYFIFSKDVGGGEWFQYYRYDMADGRVTLLTDGASRNTGAVWSRQGDRIAYHSTRRNRKDADLYVMDPREPRTDKLALQLDGGGWDVTDWSRDGGKLALIEFISVNESYIWIADLKAGTKTLITPKSGAKVAYGGAKFTADERGLWVTTDREFGFQRLARLDLASGRHDYLTTRIPWDVSDFDLSPDRRTLAYTTNEGGDFVLRLRDAASGRERRVTGLPTGVLDNPKFHRDGRELAVQSFNPRTPGDAWSIDLATGRARAWTASELGGLNPQAIQLPRRVKWKSFDGLEISGWLTQPPARFTGKRPVIIDIHGGPEGQALPMYKGRRNYFINELGVAVIDPNVRGSGGFGKDFIALDNGFLRENSYKDIGALLDWIAQQPDLDASRVMVTGGSYGGHMTWAISYLYSERLRSALPVVGMSNLVSFLQNTEAYRRDLRRAEYGDERDPKMRDFLERIAPMNHAAQIRHPVFVVQGRNDPRVPWSESDQMVRTIRSNGTPVWFLTANNEGHGFGKKPNQDFEFYATVMFIRETLLK